MTTTRRSFIKSSGLALSYTLGAQTLLLSPAAARAKKLPLRRLDAAHAASLETLAEALVPGAREAGISHYIDSQLQREPEDSLLMIRYLGVADHHTFYVDGLKSIERQAKSRYRKSLAALKSQQTDELIGALAAGEVENWSGPPAGLFYFVVRADAADVVYGTPAGFERLDIPYMPHIAPSRPW
ncbi:gluconate 2-dehydrogenase subunit 3 family protein [Exilibacterium tricleocarpae]|uniref:Gluconate 2-dehydrogenase subunit 3 family protein n=1 Tax=Exilibacterium tricleocarpae TaxID=2591008 RepID=A0A545T672_9GAMM|nr:gluconate 2-dehydrogenase subunit 3 family protein [Exilibacterium tricleocarpae]TQV72726.1 gluconate 2-dehydrogenase subunit 3 family protein [Exilibacterium tricleocarpae]